VGTPSGAVSGTTLSQLSPAASCAGAGQVVGCAYIVNGTDAQRGAVNVDLSGPDPTLTSCFARITRSAAAGNGATVTAAAICRT
jgi:hypothetical protein